MMPIEMTPGFDLDPYSATVDHFIPLVLGGRDTIANVVLACHRCNTPPTLKEILKWNALSKLWPHIQPMTLDRHVREKKRCVVCPNFIPWGALAGLDQGRS